MITVLSGGTGTPKLIQGLLAHMNQKDLSVVMNTAEDHWLPHGYFSPDVDTVVYTLAGIVDDSTWHGIRGDTHFTHETLKTLDSSEYLRIGDRDRALHIWRGELIKAGVSLSNITKKHCKVLGVEADVIPMSNDRVETVIETETGEMDLHEFWVKNQGEPSVNAVHIKASDGTSASKEAVTAIQKAKRIVIGPSNPVTSIYPILSFPETLNALKQNEGKVICVSPIIGESAFSGPAEKLMKAFGIEVSAKGIANFYKDVASHLIVDSSENIPDLPGLKIHKTDIIMDTLEKRKALANYVLSVKL
jgi:LPPG:FO 2-phospho-L-lactate transferase